MQSPWLYHFVVLLQIRGSMDQSNKLQWWINIFFDVYSPYYWVGVPHRLFDLANHHFHPMLGPHQIFHNLSHPPRIRVTMTAFQWLYT